MSSARDVAATTDGYFAVDESMPVEGRPPEQLEFPLDLDPNTPLSGVCPHTQLGQVPTPRPRVISASKRTDIPAFYLRWMLECVDAGWVDVPNPMFRRARDPLKRLTHVSLRPDHVQAIVWWSKNYSVYERLSGGFLRYPVQQFHFTINSRRADIAWLEPDVPPVHEVLRQLRFLAGLRGGPDMVAWRYDPICFWSLDGNDYTSWDANFFALMCRELSDIGVLRCFTSLADRYAKYEQRVNRLGGIVLRDPSADEAVAIGTEIAQIAASYGMRPLACTEPILANLGGFEKGACIDGRLLGATMSPATDRKMKGREECGCTLHTDIGDYLTQECKYSCIYCYANPSHARFQNIHTKNVGQY